MYKIEATTRIICQCTPVFRAYFNKLDTAVQTDRMHYVGSMRE